MNRCPMDLADVIKRIDLVHRQNRVTEYLLLAGTTLLFLCGITCFVLAITTGEFAWAAPPAVTTGLLYYPLKEIRELRRKNIALATVPALISLLPANKAAEEIQKLIENLFGRDAEK